MQAIDKPIINNLLPRAMPKADTFDFGNRCGHNKDEPRFYLRPLEHQDRPYWFQKAIDKLTHLFFQPKSRFIKRINATNPKKYKKRTERLEAIIAVTQTLIHYLEAWTLRVGKFLDDGDFLNYDAKFIAAKAGITLIRAKRAMADLVKAGYLLVKRRWDKKEDGSYRGIAGIRYVSTSLLSDLGVKPEKLFGLREWKRKRNEKAIEKAARRNGHSFIGGLLKKAFSKPKGKPAGVYTPNPRQPPPELQKRLAGEALDLQKLQPHRSVSEVYLELLAKHRE